MQSILSIQDLPHCDTPNRIAVRILPKAAASLRHGHPWLFEDSIAKLSKPASPGDIAIIYDSTQKILAAGLYDPDSTIRIRVLQSSRQMPPIGPNLFTLLIKNAKAIRDGNISSDTNAWRIIHGESDGFPGLIADKYNHTVVFKIYSSAFIPWMRDIAESVFSVYPELQYGVIRFSRAIEQTRFLRKYFMDTPHVVFHRDGFLEFTNPVEFLENGIKFRADVLLGQKTGFFLDQRDNRADAERLANGCRVLNVFSFSGGFSLYAARGGAKSVCSIDADPHALDALTQHVAMNQNHPNIAKCSFENMVGDAFECMKQLVHDKRKFELVIIDPPSFAKSAAEQASALHSYGRLAKLANSLLSPNATLMFASCSSRVTADELFPVVLDNCHIREFKRTAHAVDHPAKFAESSYLKCLYGRKLP